MLFAAHVDGGQRWRHEARGRNIVEAGDGDLARHLDAKRASGAIDQHTYEARRAETQELIRRGRAVEYSRAEAVGQAALAVALLLGGIAIALMAGSNGALLGITIGMAGIVFGVLTWRKLRASVVRWRN